MDIRVIPSEPPANPSHDRTGSPARQPLMVHFLLGMPVQRRGPAYTAVKIAETIRIPGLDVQLFGHPNIWPTELDVPVNCRRALPGEALATRSGLRPILKYFRNVSARRLLAYLDRHPDNRNIVYTWGETPIETTRELTRRNIPIVREKINCAKATSQRILNDAYAKLGATPPLPITNAMLDKEAEEMALASAVFCPSPMVRKSLLEIGVPADRLITTSYGWEPRRFSGTDRALQPVDRPTFLFVGMVCVRKGAHILLEAWERAGRPGRLVLVGEMEPLIASRYARILSDPSVSYFPYTPNIAALFRSTDWFVFPTLEEGGPQVTYEAAGCGVPAIVSEMGAGAFTRDGVDGEIVHSNTVESWAEALERLGTNAELRIHYARNARQHAQDFTWERVGEKRGAELLRHFSQRGSTFR